MKKKAFCILGAAVLCAMAVLPFVMPEKTKAAAKQIKITSGSGEKAFDGNPLTYLDSAVSDWTFEGTDANYIFTYPNDFLPSGDADAPLEGKFLVYLTDTSEITMPGTVDNEFGNVHIYTVTDGKYKDVTSNYDIETEFGTLKVTSGGGDGEEAGLVLDKKAEADATGRVTIDLEQYVSGSNGTENTVIGRKDILIWVDYTASMKKKLNENSKISCLAAAKQATNRMIEQAAAINEQIADEGDKIRICAIGIGGKAKAIFPFTTVTNVNMNSLQKKITNSSASDFSGNTGGSRHDLACELAFKKFKELADDPANADRQMICIGVADMLVNQPEIEDGVKTSDDNKNPERNAMIKFSRKMKNMGVKCYSVYTARKAYSDTTSLGNKLSKYKKGNVAYYVANMISSDFPFSKNMSTINEYDSNDDGIMTREYTRTPATSEDIIVLIDDATGLDNNGGIGLDANAEIRDFITAPFSLTDKTSIQAFTADRIKSGDDFSWDSPVPVDVTIKADAQYVRVTGFDYEKNYVSTEPHEGTDDDYGKKLIIRFTIDPKRSFGGNQIPTNEETSGIYKDTHEITDIYEAYPVPEVDIPLDYAIGTEDQTIYIPDTANIRSTVERDGDALFAATHVPDGTNNKYVKIDYTLKDNAGKILATMSIPEGTDGSTAAWNWETNETETQECGQFTVDCTVTPTTNGTYEKKDLTQDAFIHVFTPSVRFVDSSQDIGDVADVTFGTELSLSKLNAHQAVVTWSSRDGTQSVAAEEPELTFRAQAESGVEYIGNKAIITAADEVPIKVQVTAENTDITGQTEFEHDCDLENCDFEEHLAKGDNFLIHVNGLLYNCDLTITKTIKERQEAFGTPVFMFRVYGYDIREKYHEWLAPVRIEKGLSGERTLKDLPPGTYAVEEMDDPRWKKLDITPGEFATATKDKATVTFPVDRNGASASVTFGNEYNQYVPGYSDAVINHLETAKR